MATQFQIVELLLEGKTSPCPQFGLFTDGKMAAAQASILGTSMGKRFQVRPVEAEADWRARERQRFADGTYTPLPWANRVNLDPDHFAHISEKSPGSVAYIADEARGKSDRQSSLPVNRYLTTFFPNMNQYERKLICKLHLGVDEDVNLKFATTDSEVTWVYRHGPDSCMAGEFELDKHPTTAYIAGDLAIAYLEDLEGRVIARGLCWPDKKIYGRLYGDIEELSAHLQREGYLYDHLGFTGARLKTEWVEGYDGDGDFFSGYLCPYVDVIGRGYKRDDHFVLDLDGDYGLQDTGGVAYSLDDDEQFICECGRQSHFTSYCEEDSGDYICAECAIKRARMCCVSAQGIYSHRRHVLLHDGRGVVGDYVDSHTFVCPQTGERWLRRDGLLKNGVLVSPNYKELAA